MSTMRSSGGAARAAYALEDFHLVRRLGEGSYAEVVEAEHRATGACYALKIVEKELILRHKQAKYIKAERALLDRLSHTGIISLFFTFQDPARLYLGLELCPNGELFNQIVRKGRLREEEARFYAAEIVLILEYLRQQQVVHRDLKPENLLLTESGHLKLADFGSALDVGLQQGSPAGPDQLFRATSLVGTADYVSPEMLRSEPVSYSSDLWALGCVLVQMLSGRAPFKTASEYLTFQRVAAAQYEMPEVSPAACSLIKRLLVVDPGARLGARDLEQLKRADFFRGIDWGRVQELPPPEVASPSAAEREEQQASLDWELTSLAATLPLQYSYGGAEGPSSLPAHSPRASSGTEAQAAHAGPPSPREAQPAGRGQQDGESAPGGREREHGEGRQHPGRRCSSPDSDGASKTEGEASRPGHAAERGRSHGAQATLQSATSHNSGRTDEDDDSGSQQGQQDGSYALYSAATNVNLSDVVQGVAGSGQNN